MPRAGHAVIKSPGQGQPPVREVVPHLLRTRTQVNIRRGRPSSQGLPKVHAPPLPSLSQPIAGGFAAYLAMITSIVSSRLCGPSSFVSTSGLPVGESNEAVFWPVTASSALWNLTLTILLTPCSCMVMP